MGHYTINHCTHWGYMNAYINYYFDTKETFKCIQEIILYYCIRVAYVLLEYGRYVNLYNYFFFLVDNIMYICV